MVVDGDGERLLGDVLADDVVLEEVEDLARLRQVVEAQLAALGELLLDDLVAEVDALVADVHPGPAMSFLTCFWLFPQKEHLRRSPPSPMRATDSLLVRRRRTLRCTRPAPLEADSIRRRRGHPRSRNAVCPLMADKRRRSHLSGISVESDPAEPSSPAGRVVCRRGGRARPPGRDRRRSRRAAPRAPRRASSSATSRRLRDPGDAPDQSRSSRARRGCPARARQQGTSEGCRGILHPLAGVEHESAVTCRHGEDLEPAAFRCDRAARVLGDDVGRGCRPALEDLATSSARRRHVGCSRRQGRRRLRPPR